MGEDNSKRKEFSTDEKRQVSDMIRFLFMVLAAVVAASLVMAVVIPIITQ